MIITRKRCQSQCGSCRRVVGNAILSSNSNFMYIYKFFFTYICVYDNYTLVIIYYKTKRDSRDLKRVHSRTIKTRARSTSLSPWSVGTWFQVQWSFAYSFIHSTVHRRVPRRSIHEYSAITHRVSSRCATGMQVSRLSYSRHHTIPSRRTVLRIAHHSMLSLGISSDGVLFPTDDHSESPAHFCILSERTRFPSVRVTRRSRPTD